MYERYYGLRELPFELTPNPQYLFLTERHRGALCNLQYAITARRGITLLVGEAGTGKTTLVHAALGVMRRDDARCVYLNNPTLTRAEFVESLAYGFGLGGEARQSKAVFLRELERLLVARLAAGAMTALIIDEAQSLPHDLLEETRLLANMETATEKLLPVVLAGQPELADRLNEPSLRQLKQRVGLRCDLAPFRLHETASYIFSRLERAGGKSAEIFTREAVEAIHARSGGIARTISVVCDNALISGFAGDRRPVDREIILEVCCDLGFGGNGHAAIAHSESPVAAPAPAAPRAGRDVPVPKAQNLEGIHGRQLAARGVGELFASFARRDRFSFFRDDV